MAIVEEKQKFELKSRVYRYEVLEEFVHWHERMEIVQILDNKSRFIVDAQSIQAEKGDLIVLKEGAIHLHIIEDGPCEYRLIHFPYKLFFDVNRFPNNVKVHIKNEEIKEIPYLAENLNAIFEVMDRQGEVAVAEENPFFCYLIMAVYTELTKYFPEDESMIPGKSERKEIYKTLEYINEHFKENINIQDISDAMFISRSRLTKLFTKYAGMGINEYITSLRIKNANHLLSAGHNVTEAAIDSGFQSIRTFNNTYKAYTGITPTEYIRKYIKKKTIDNPPEFLYNENEAKNREVQE